jgi:hypothetical protein
MLQLLNIVFLVLHASWVVFVCVGWIWKRTRFWHLLAVVITALSWFGLGIWYGWGYCVCTDWHWQVRDRLGYLPDHSYIHLLILELTGIDVPPAQADLITGITFALAALISVTLNWRDFLRRPTRAHSTHQRTQNL